jgi:catechol 2,3-dioxygenase-like lactoylglutathione lyase family enzyme
MRLAVAVLTGATLVNAQTPPPHVEPAGEVVGLAGLMLNVRDVDRSVPFYRDVLGLELRSAPASFTADPSVLTLYNAAGGRYRAVAFTLPGAPPTAALELVEFRGISDGSARGRIQDPGAVTLFFYVTNVTPFFERLKAARAPIVTSSGKPVRLPEPFGAVPAVFAEDPDGFVIGIVEQPAPGSVFGFAVDDAEAALKFYVDALGFGYVGRVPFTGNDAMMDMLGTPGAQVLTIALYVPGTSYQMEILEFKDIDRRPVRTADQLKQGAFVVPGTAAPMFTVRDLPSLATKLRRAGAPVATAGGQAVRVGADTRAVVRDPSGVFIQLSQRGQPAGRPEGVP